MPKVLKVKLKYQDDVQTIAATRVEEKSQRLAVFNDAEQVGSFSVGEVEHWWFTDGATKVAEEKF
jgi:hypothetical protein